jgi:hypothetical protein
MTWWQWMVWVSGALLLAGTGFYAYGAWRWAGDTRQLLHKLDASRIDKKSGGGMVDKKMVMAPWEGHWSNYQPRMA